MQGTILQETARAPWVGMGNSAGGMADDAGVIERLRLPPDLRQWFDSTKLLGWVEAEALKLEQNALSPSISVGDVAACPAWNILALLSFAYLTQVFGSEDIVLRCQTDPVFRTLCGGHALFAQHLISFRRRHRELLETVMAGALLIAIGQKFDVDLEPPPFGLEQDLRERARERLDIARHMDVK